MWRSKKKKPDPSDTDPKVMLVLVATVIKLEEAAAELQKFVKEQQENVNELRKGAKEV